MTTDSAAQRPTTNGLWSKDQIDATATWIAKEVLRGAMDPAAGQQRFTELVHASSTPTEVANHNRNGFITSRGHTARADLREVVVEAMVDKILETTDGTFPNLTFLAGCQGGQPTSFSGWMRIWMGTTANLMVRNLSVRDKQVPKSFTGDLTDTERLTDAGRRVRSAEEQMLDAGDEDRFVRYQEVAHGAFPLAKLRLDANALQGLYKVPPLVRPTTHALAEDISHRLDEQPRIAYELVAMVAGDPSTWLESDDPILSMFSEYTPDHFRQIAAADPRVVEKLVRAGVAPTPPVSKQVVGLITERLASACRDRMSRLAAHTVACWGDATLLIGGEDGQLWTGRAPARDRELAEKFAASASPLVRSAMFRFGSVSELERWLDDQPLEFPASRSETVMRLAGDLVRMSLRSVTDEARLLVATWSAHTTTITGYEFRGSWTVKPDEQVADEAATYMRQATLLVRSAASPFATVEELTRWLDDTCEQAMVDHAATLPVHTPRKKKPRQAA